MRGAAVACLVLCPAAIAWPSPLGSETAIALWRVAGEGRGVPAVSGSTAYFLTKRHEVVAVDAASGRVRWRRSTGGPGEETLGSSVVAHAGVVIAGDYAIVGFDAATGARRWRFEPGRGYGAGLYLGEAHDALVFAGSSSGHLYGVDVSDGRLRWSAQPVAEPDTTMFQPVVAGDLVVAGYSTFGRPIAGGVVAVDRLTGRERWRREFPGASLRAATGFGGGPAVTGDLVIAGSGDGQIHGFDRGSGLPRWVRPSVTRADGRRADRDWRALAVSGPWLAAGSVTGVVTMSDIKTGAESWRYAHPDGGSVALRITADERSVYVPHLGGLLVALDSRDGHERWKIGGFSDGFNWAPAIAGERAYVAASRTGLFALPR
jgi:outer membrane protein assembly factor BamB